MTDGATLVLDGGTIAAPVQLRNNAALAPGTVPAGYAVTLYGARVPGPGLVTNNGTLTLIGATAAGPVANAGTLVATTLDNTGSTTVSTLAGGLTNTGTLRVLARPNASAQLDVPGTLANAPGATVELTSGGAGPASASLYVTGTLDNAGDVNALAGSGGGGRYLGGTISNRTGATIAALGRDLTLSNAGLTNSGTVSATAGLNLVLNGATTLAGAGIYQGSVINGGQLTVGRPSPTSTSTAASNRPRVHRSTLPLAVAASAPSASSTRAVRPRWPAR